MNIPVQPILARRLIRLAIVAAVQRAAATAAIDGRAWTVASPGDWPTPPEKCPAVLIRTTGDTKSEWHKGQSAFESTINIQILGRVNCPDEEAAQDQIEAMGYIVEEAVLGDYWLRQVISQFVTVVTEQEVNSDGEYHFGGFQMSLGVQTSETFIQLDPVPVETVWPPPPPADPVDLESVHIDVDAANVYSPTGTFVNPDFPNSATPDPRTTGPDGRVEVTGGSDTLQEPQS
jgi:hypothetical protein